MRTPGYKTVDALVDWLTNTAQPPIRRATPEEIGFARSRAATVIARGDVQLRVLAPEALTQLLAEFPRIERETRRTAHERLRRAR